MYVNQSQARVITRLGEDIGVHDGVVLHLNMKDFIVTKYPSNGRACSRNFSEYYFDVSFDSD